MTGPVNKDSQSQRVTATTEEELDGSTSGKLRPVGVVISAGKMDKTVKVRLPGQKWNRYLRKVWIISCTNKRQ
jgi:small subunit ribosomal protein S17